MSDKPNCYECKFRGRVPGSAHSSCNHPKIEGKDSNPFGAMMQLMMGDFGKVSRELGITANAHGINKGWFLWPANFDPVWLTTCKGFESKVSAE